MRRHPSHVAHWDAVNHESPLGSPLIPPREWLLEVPEWFWTASAGDIKVVLTGDETGRAAGLYYDHDVCYMNDLNECWLPPASPSNNEPFHAGHIPYSDFDLGEDIPVGTIPITHGHTDTDLPFEEAVQARNDLPERQRLVGTLWDVMMPRDRDDPSAGERQVGLFLGAATPEMTVGEAMMVNRSALSGEWWPRRNFIASTGQTVDIALDALGPVLVSRAAIPTNRRGKHQTMNSELSQAAVYTRTAAGVVLGPSIYHFGDQPMEPAPAGLTPAAASVVEPATTAAPCCDACAGKDNEPATAATDDGMATVEDLAMFDERISRIEGWIAKQMAADIVDPAEATVRRAAVGVSHGDLRARLDQAIRSAHGDSNDETYIWIVDVFDESVIYEVERADDVDTFEQNYDVDEDGSVTLAGTPMAVVRETTYAPA